MASEVQKHCKDCGSTTKKLSYPGPRCLGCHRAVVKTRKATAHENRVQQVYGLLPGEYDLLYAKQGGKCALCLIARGLSKKLAVDHDHKSGKVRGLLCTNCNKHVLGHARDSIEYFERAIEYLRNPPASDLPSQRDVEDGNEDQD